MHCNVEVWFAIVSRFNNARQLHCPQVYPFILIPESWPTLLTVQRQGSISLTNALSSFMPLPGRFPFPRLSKKLIGIWCKQNPIQPSRPIRHVGTHTHNSCATWVLALQLSQVIWREMELCNSATFERGAKFQSVLESSPCSLLLQEVAEKRDNHQHFHPLPCNVTILLKVGWPARGPIFQLCLFLCGWVSLRE